MKKIAAALLVASTVLVGVSASAHADGYYNRGGGHWVGPFVGGAVVGGLVGSVLVSPPPPPVVYYAPPPAYYPPQCWQEFAYYDAWNRPVYRTVCR